MPYFLFAQQKTPTPHPPSSRPSHSTGSQTQPASRVKGDYPLCFPLLLLHHPSLPLPLPSASYPLHTPPPPRHINCLLRINHPVPVDLPSIEIFSDYGGSLSQSCGPCLVCCNAEGCGVCKQAGLSGAYQWRVGGSFHCNMVPVCVKKIAGSAWATHAIPSSGLAGVAVVCPIWRAKHQPRLSADAFLLEPFFSLLQQGTCQCQKACPLSQEGRCFARQWRQRQSSLGATYTRLKRLARGSLFRRHNLHNHNHAEKGPRKAPSPPLSPENKSRRPHPSESQKTLPAHRHCFKCIRVQRHCP